METELRAQEYFSLKQYKGLLNLFIRQIYESVE